MPFIGNQPALSYTSFAKQDFTTSATTSYTLDHPVANENEIALFINFVRQEPTTAYTASGTSLTLTSATSASDDMYCVFLGKAVQTINPPNSSVGISQLSATGTKDATTFLRGDNTFASAGGTNTPAFGVSGQAADQTFNDNTATKVIFNNEIVDTNNAYDTSNYRFTVPSGQAGKYLFSACLWLYDANGSITEGAIRLVKNGSILINLATGDDMQRLALSLDVMDNSSVGDYYEVFVYADTSDSGTVQVAGSGSTSNYRSFFQGYKIIE